MGIMMVGNDFQGSRLLNYYNFFFVSSNGDFILYINIVMSLLL
jgi:hypothetical protein